MIVIFSQFSNAQQDYANLWKEVETLEKEALQENVKQVNEYLENELKTKLNFKTVGYKLTAKGIRQAEELGLILK